MGALLVAVGLQYQMASAQPAGGRQSVFQLGVGARALSLGGAAFVAMPSDASAIYWNPGGLDQISRSSVTLFYTNLLGGAAYNYLGFVQPTLNSGTFGVGILRVGVGDIPDTDESNITSGSFGFNQLEFLISYSKQMPYNFSLGANIKVERQTFDKQSASGIGADFGLIYAPEFSVSFLQNVKFGLTVQNLLQPELRQVDRTDKIPYIVRFGVAKPVKMGGDGDGINFLLGVEHGGEAKLHIHTGAEYTYRGMAMLRTGISKGDSSAQISFGAGVIYKNYQLDYSFGKFAPNELLTSHRFSLSIEFGHTRAEMAKIAEDRRLAAIEKEVTEQLRFKRNSELQSNVEAGKALFQQNNFFAAYIKFAAARDIDPNDPEAGNWLKRTQEKIDEEQRARQAQLAKQAQADAVKQEQRDFVENQFRKGLSYFEAGKFPEAIQQWQLGLDRDPENAQIKMWMEKTRSETSARISEMLRRADGLAREGRYVEAIDLLQQVRQVSLNDSRAQKDIQDKIERLRRSLSYMDLYRQGLTEYTNKSYAAAVGFFAQALKVDPNNEKVKKYYNDAEARANARVEDFYNESIRGRFIQAQQLLQSGDHAQALQILEAIQQEQRYNKRILDAIDLARERLRK
jgi:tetratricopeptide (TPR) repeat protein